MNTADLIADLDQISATLFTTAGLAQVVYLLMSCAVAWAAVRALRRHMPDRGDLPGGWKAATASFNRVVFPLVLLGLAWLGKLLLGRLFSATILKLALPLVASFAAIRFTVYLLRNLIPRSPLLNVSERVIAYSIWVVVALYLTGLLPDIENSLGEIAFTVGKQKISFFMVLTGLLTVIATLLVAVALSRLAEERIMRADAVDLSLRMVIAKLVHALALVFAVLIALPLVGIDVTVLSVFGGALGVGIGFGLQKVAGNYVSGFIVLIERSIRVGDLVTVENRSGTVTRINARYTVIRSLDGTEVLLPNETLITGAVINHTYSDPVTALKIPLAIAYGSDLDTATRVLLGAAASQARVLADPAPNVLVRNLGDIGIELDLVVWMRDADRGQANLKSDIYRAALSELDQAGIEIPFPQHVVHVKREAAIRTETQPRSV